MALDRAPRDLDAEKAAFALATLVPFVAYVATASGFGFWQDGGEIVAAAVDLDIAHPPGHPLASLVGRAFAYLPFGPLAFRVALGQAACAALASGFFARAVDTTLRAQGVRHPRVALAMSVGASWIAAFAYGFWLQGVRPEVYALEALLVAVVVERVVAVEAAWPTHDVRPLNAAALALGLGLANHHFMAILTLPAFLPTLVRTYRAKGARPVGWIALSIALGLLAYAYLPVRAHTEPPVDLGDPRDPANFVWVVSARAYQSSHGLTPQPLFDRMMDVLIALFESVNPLVVLLALAGAWALLRAPGARRLGFIWVAIAAVGALGRGWLGFVAGNPDALGYLMPVMQAIVALAAAFGGAIVALVIEARDEARREEAEAPSPRRENAKKRAAAPEGPPALALGVAAALVLGGLATLRFTAPRVSLLDFTSTDSFDGVRYRNLPTGAVVIAYGPETVFRHWSARAVEATRPDVTLLPMPFLGYPGMIRSLSDREPVLGEILRGYLIDGALRQPDVQSLATERPLLVEMNPRLPSGLLDTVVPSGLLYNVEPAGASDADIERGARAREGVLERLYGELGAPIDAQTRAQLVWLHYQDALFFARLGSHDAAMAATGRGLALVPESAELVALQRALLAESGPIDVTPFQVATPE